MFTPVFAMLRETQIMFYVKYPDILGNLENFVQFWTVLENVENFGSFGFFFGKF